MALQLKLHHNSIGIKAVSGLIASACAGILENYGFHPLDTAVKRLQADRSKGHLSVQKFKRVVFQGSYDKGILSKYKSLFPGLKYAVAYKIFQRTYKFGTQPVIRELVSLGVANYTNIPKSLGPARTRTLCDGISGAIVGAGEIMLLPLDAIKIRQQASKDPNKKANYKNLYSGIGWTLARNIPGSFALFGVSSLVKEALFKLNPASRKTGGTVVQNFIASLAGSVASIVVSAPMDMMKVRAQIGKSTSLAEFVRTEGVASLWKGTSVKLFSATPRLIFAFTLSQMFTHKLEGKINRMFNAKPQK